MLSFLVAVLQSTLIVPLTLLPIINPVGNAPIFVSMTGGNRALGESMARQVSINAWVILTVSMLVGTYVLGLFGISLAIVRLGGGILVATTGWRLLQANENDSVREAVADHSAELSKQEVARMSFFPMSFPLTAGPGSIAASIALGTGAGEQRYLVGLFAAVLGGAITVAVVYLCYRYASSLLSRLGEIATLVMMRFMAFILMCIGLQMMWAGWADLNHLGA